MSDKRDGFNISSAPDDFVRPETPPPSPPALDILPCRCGRIPEEILDGSIFGCTECYVSAMSVREWNNLVDGENSDLSDADVGYLINALISARGDLHNARFLINKCSPGHHWLSGFDRGIAKIDSAITKARGYRL